ncbi:TRAP dicarboxylate transporter- DctP subunit [Pusillimonas sp. T7-7]|uniref:TRAP transporter substrate-binding protein n=1 Tax=Pusillimonas sp. (strain T7-7) TaxID=1007105 RepID=UPI0002084459|nr:TRAP transporter substrate-binding protein DctP [Pusillimonas sp. T7-7]AEC19205.1 TRAP dicarboxylate transporter- DctP subunit [Pusillimonas sp. T7-7]
MKIKAIHCSTLAISLGLGLGMSSVANAADTITLRVADSFPTGHYIPDALTKPFMEEVERKTNNAVKFEYYPGQQLGKAKDMLSLTQSGVADIAYVAPSFVSDKMPLAAVAELPGNFTTSCEGTVAYWKLAQEGGILDEKEFKPLGIHVLFTLVLPPYQVFLGHGELKNIASIQGMKIRTSGGAKDIAARKLGAVSIQMATPEVHEALSRGTIDGMLFPYSSIISYDLQNMVKYSTVGENFGSFIVNYAISEKKWKALSPEIQKAMTEVGNAVTAKACEVSQERESSDMKKIEAAGDKLVTLSAADKKTVSELMSTVGTEWAQELDKRGKAGTEVLNTFKEALK